jgi:hypothetical protein
MCVLARSFFCNSTPVVQQFHPWVIVNDCNLPHLGNPLPSAIIIPSMKTMLLALVALFSLTFVASAADISGKWTVDASAAPAGGQGGRGGMGMQTYEFKAAGAALTGSITRAGRNGGEPTVTQIADGKITGDTFTFSVTNNMGGNEMKVVYTGKVVGDKLELTFDMGGRGARTITLVKGQ